MFEIFFTLYENWNTKKNIVKLIGLLNIFVKHYNLNLIILKNKKMFVKNKLALSTTKY